MPTRLLAISGSLQRVSTNTALVQLAVAIAPAGLEVSVFDQLGELPYFNPDLEGDAPPLIVKHWRVSVGAADGVLIASPEYAHEMPGVLKNALDWLVSSGELYGKRVAVVCAAPSAQRGVYVRQALQQTLAAQGADVVVSETIAVPPHAVSSPLATEAMTRVLKTLTAPAPLSPGLAS